MLESRANSKRVSRTLIYVSVATVSSKDFNSHRQSQGSRNKDSNKSFSPLLDLLAGNNVSMDGISKRDIYISIYILIVRICV